VTFRSYPLTINYQQVDMALSNFSTTKSQGANTLTFSPIYAILTRNHHGFLFVFLGKESKKTASDAGGFYLAVFDG
jgi:hypothetical protein